MKLCAPTYYEKFKCIADKCKHSCCTDWEIEIDDSAYQKYLSFTGDLRKRVLDSVCEDNGARVFAMTESGRCPHLNEKGLCNIILEAGESALTDICREHPRFYNTVGGRKEVGLGLSCEAAAELILTFDSEFTLLDIGEVRDEEGSLNYSALEDREYIIDFIERRDICYAEKINILSEKYFLRGAMRELTDWFDLISGLEVLEQEWKDILESSRGKPKICDVNERYLERLLTYFVYRHLSTADNEMRMRATLVFSLISVEIIKYLFERTDGDFASLVNIAILYSSEIEYSEDNTAEIIFEAECLLA